MLEQNIGDQTLYFSGDTLRIKFTVTDLDASPNVPKDLTGATLTWVLAKSQGKTPILEKTNGSPEGITLDSPLTLGTGEILVDPADTRALKGTHYHELEVVDALGNTSTVFFGSFVIQEDSAGPQT